MAMQISFSSKTASLCSEEEIKSMSELFSSHYGIWSAAAPSHLVGRRVRLSSQALKDGYLFDDRCVAHFAKSADGILVGCMITRQFAFCDREAIWISQLVVHSDWRIQKVASRLMAMAIAVPHELVGVGMATSHPYAVRAMEKVFNKTCNPTSTIMSGKSFVEASGIPYLQGKPLRLLAQPPTSIIETSFFVDHSEVNAIRAQLSGSWHLGTLGEGEEFLALALRV